jgi:hypothetical protein
MTFAKLSTTHKNAIGTDTEGIDNKQRIHSSRAHDPDRPDIWGILKSGNTR